MTKNEKQDAYELVTNEILDALANGVAPWRRPWVAVNSGAVRSTGERYKGINQFLLSLKAATCGYQSRVWVTFKQALAWVPKDEKGGVRKGEKSTVVVYWNFVKRKNKDTGKDETIPFLKYYRVFNIDQCDNVKLPQSLKDKVETPLPVPSDPVAEAEAVIERYLANGGPTLTFSMGSMASYSPMRDAVSMPAREQFTSASGLYTTLFHELVHSTGHKSRLGRLTENGTLAPFGSEDYSKEELVAELGSAFILAAMGIDADVPNSAAYFRGWQRTFLDDKRALVWAAGRAAKAADMVLGITEQGEDDNETEAEQAA